MRHNMRRRRYKAAHQVENQKAQFAQFLFNAGAKDRQEQHVERKVQDAGVQEHREQQRLPQRIHVRTRSDDARVRRKVAVRLNAALCLHLACPITKNSRQPWREKHDDVDRDQ